MTDVKPVLFNTDMVRATLAGLKTVTRRAVRPQNPSEPHPHLFAKIPYSTGDILYVRETWSKDPDGRYVYRANCCDKYAAQCNWRPSIHMPREAARIFLRVMDVRVERLQDINNAGALAEGCDGRCESPQDGALSDCQKNYDFSVEKFQTVWDSTIKPADRAIYGWEANPWVWVIEFEKIRKEDAK